MPMLKFGTAAGATIAFADEANISRWAAEAVKAAASLQLVKGRAESNFDPQGIATRAESAQVIYILLTLSTMNQI